jgi:hypothetical protein
MWHLSYLNIFIPKVDKCYRIIKPFLSVSYTRNVNISSNLIHHAKSFKSEFEIFDRRYTLNNSELYFFTFTSSYEEGVYKYGKSCKRDAFEYQSR